MTTASIPQPGVQVVQQFRTVSPTIITPTLMPNVVGVAREVVEVLSTDSAGSVSLNTDALVVLPAYFQSADAVAGLYTGLNGLSLVVSINNGVNITITFSDPLSAGISPASMVAQVLAAFATAGVTAATAEVVGTDTWMMRTIGVGDFQSIYIDPTSAPTVLLAFGLNAGTTFTGVSTYAQYELGLNQANFPDPRGNLDELVIETNTIRVFLATGSGISLREALRDEAFLRRSGDDSAAQIVGTVDLSTFVYGIGGTVDTKTITISTDRISPAETVGFVAPGNIADLLAQIEAQTTGLSATVTLGTNYLVLTSNTTGSGSSIHIVSATYGIPPTPTNAAEDMGLTVGGASTPIVGVATGGPESPAIFTGTVVPALPTAGGETLVMSVTNSDGTTVSDTIALTGALGTLEALLADIAAKIVASNIGYEVAATVNGSNYVVLSTADTGAGVSFTIGAASTALTLLGLTAGTQVGEDVIAVVDDGNGDAVSPLLKCLNQDFTAAAVVASVVGTVDLTTLVYGPGGTIDGKTLVLSDGSLPQTITFNAPAAAANVILAIDAIMAAPGGTLAAAALGLNNELILASTATGSDAVVHVVGGTAVADLGLTVGKTVGTLGVVAPEDELYVDGVYLGKVVQVAPGGQVDYLKIDSQLPMNTSLGQHFYIVAKGLPLAGRPTPELVIDGNGNVLVKSNLLRDTTGAEITGLAPLYLMYNAIRQDVTALADTPGLIKVNGTSELSEQLSPISTDNPLGLGMYFAALNAPGVQITGLGVDAISADAPFGTVEAFTRAAEFLEGYEVYAIAPLTHDASTFQVFQTHVNFMAEDEQKGERIVLINPEQPSRAVDILVASGTNGDSVGATGTLFDTKVVNLSALVLNAGINPVGTIPASEGLYLDISLDSKKYNISAISGSQITIRTVFSPGENDDSFYATTDLNDPPLPTTIISENFSIKARGAELVTTAGTPDKNAIALAYQQMGQGYADRRVWQVIASALGATIGGLEQLIDGFYGCAAIAGMIGQYPPQQSFTNIPMTGFTSVQGTNGYFSSSQLNVIAGGGNYILIQEAESAPIISRMALTTDVTSVETRTDSINKVVDFTSKFLRNSNRTFIGRFNITQGFMDTLGTVNQGLLEYEKNHGIILGGDLNNIIQDEDAPDTVLIDVIIDPPYPCNYIRITIVI